MDSWKTASYHTVPMGVAHMMDHMNVDEIGLGMISSLLVRHHATQRLPNLSEFRQQPWSIPGDDFREAVLFCALEGNGHCLRLCFYFRAMGALL